MNIRKLKVFSLFKQANSVLSFLDPPDKRRVVLVSVARILSNSLDLIGLALISVLVSIAMQQEGSKIDNPLIVPLLDFVGLQDISRKSALIATATASAGFFVCKSYLSLRLLRSSVHIVANAETRVAEKVSHLWLDSPNSGAKNFSITTTTYALLQSLNSLISSQLNALITIVSEASFLILILVALIFYNPLMTLGVLTYFVIVGVLIQRKTLKNIDLHSRNVSLGWLKSATVISDTMNVFKEISIFGIRSTFIQKFIVARRKVAHSSAEAEYLIGTPRYFVESALYVGVLLLSLPVMFANDVSGAIQNVVVFLVAATRMIPSLLPLQQSVTNLRMSQVRGETAANFMSKFKILSAQTKSMNELNVHSSSELTLSRVSVTHLNGKLALANINVSVTTGEYVAVVGPSGAGKTTFLETCLGLIPASEGDVAIRGSAPLLSLDSGIQHAAYVPQNISLIEGTVRENITFYQDTSETIDSDIWKILEELGLKSRIKEMEFGLDSIIGSEGESLSGGERQRIGIARALFNKPDILFLDEATSALDPTTETVIQRVLSDRTRFPTVIAVAHRIGTVRDASKIIYLKGGKIVEIGTYEELLKSSSDFATQIQALLDSK